MIPVSLRSYNLAQTFFLDPSLTKNSREAAVSRVDLFFRAKPPATNNKSGILNPGVEVSIVPCLNGVPAVEEVSAIRPTDPAEHGARFTFFSSSSISRLDWGEIIATTDASTPTIFKFPRPVFLKTGQEYAILVKYDGNEDFILWETKKGNPLVGTTTPSPGVSGPNVGNLFTFIGPIQPFATPLTSTTVSNSASTINTAKNIIADSTVSQDRAFISSNWKPVLESDLKFTLYVARFFQNNTPVFTNNAILNDPFVTGTVTNGTNNTPITQSGGVITLTAQAERVEFISYDPKNSVSTSGLKFGEKFYQTAPSYPGGTNSPLTISVTLNSNRVVANSSYLLPNGSTFFSAGGFNSIYSADATNDQYVIVKSGNNVNVRRVLNIVSPSEITVEEPFTFTNTAATFFRAPVGKIKAFERSFINGKTTSLVTLYDSNANSNVRFVNNTITEVGVSAAGEGYSNSDYLVINGFEDIDYSVKGGYPAYANIVTNSSGNVVSVLVSNAGAGFVNTAWLAGSNIQVTNSSGQPVQISVANGLSLSFSVGATIEGELSNGNTKFSNCVVLNVESMRGKPEITVNNPLGTTYSIKHRHLYFKTPDSNTYSGSAVYVNPNPSSQDRTLKIFKSHSLADYSNLAIIPSRSNQYSIRYANGAIPSANVTGVNGSNSSIFLFEVSSNNDYMVPYFDPDVCRLHFSKYEINNSYVNEHTNYGEAFSKHVTTKVSFGQDRFAEDLLVYLTAYRPANTDIKVYARIHHSDDPEAFDDKDWTLLELIDGVDVFSSKDNSADFVELTYNFTSYPNTQYTVDGSITLQQGNTLIVGSGTDFSNSTVGVAGNNLVKIYDPLFPNNYMVAVVNNVINATAFHIKRSFGDLSANGTGTVSVSSSSVDVTGTSTTFLTGFSNGDYLAVWSNSTVYETRQINRVISDTSMNLTSSFTFSNAASNYSRLDQSNYTNLGITGSGLKLDKLEFKHQGFNNRINDNVVRYYNTSMVEYDGYNTFQLKIVFLSDNEYLVPKVDDVRAIGVSA